MKKIVLISTVHREDGLCTSGHLLALLTSYRPEVIFQEMPPSAWKDYYVTKTKLSLESTAVEIYLSQSAGKSVPVDLDYIPTMSDFLRIDKLWQAVEKSNVNYCRLMDLQNERKSKLGFSYLNSLASETDCANANLEVDITVGGFGSTELSETYSEWLTLLDKRESAMIENIDAFCRYNEFSIAVFLLGTAHRKTIFEKYTKKRFESSISDGWELEKYESENGWNSHLTSRST